MKDETPKIGKENAVSLGMSSFSEGYLKGLEQGRALVLGIREAVTNVQDPTMFTKDGCVLLLEKIAESLLKLKQEAKKEFDDLGVGPL